MIENRHDTSDALLLFVDIVDSSGLSTYLGYGKYASTIVLFEELFRKIANIYFPENESMMCRKIDTRGDEGTVFIIKKPEELNELVYRAICFVMELKAHLNMTSYDEGAPKLLNLGAGIHVGTVAIVSSAEGGGDDKLYGYNINYAKRIESSSRSGSYSKIYLSRRAASLLDSYPVILKRNTISMKGMQENEEIYEVQSALLNPMPKIDIERFKNFYTDELFDPVRWDVVINEPWIKSVVLSVLYSVMRKPLISAQYADNYKKLIWKNPAEDDPIILYLRGVQCSDEAKYTQMLSYFKKLVDKHPSFIAARIMLAAACLKVSKSSHLSVELILARDTANELIERFSDMLTSDEEESLKNLLKEISCIPTQPDGVGNE